ERRLADSQHAADVGHHVDNLTSNEVNDPLLDIAQFLARVVNQPVIGEVKLPEAAGTQQLDLVRVKLKLVRAQKDRRASQQIGVQHGRVFKLACVVDEHVVYRRGSLLTATLRRDRDLLLGDPDIIPLDGDDV